MPHRFALVPDSLEGAYTAPAGLVEDLRPIDVIGVGELGEQPLHGALGGIHDFVAQLESVRLVPTAEKDTSATQHLGDAVLDPPLGGFQLGLDGIACLGGFRCRRWAMVIDDFLGGELRRESLTKLLVPEAGEEAKKHGIARTGGTGVGLDRLFLFGPPVANPQNQLVVRLRRAGGGKLDLKVARLT
jgi:hypothetical protein